MSERFKAASQFSRSLSVSMFALGLLYASVSDATPLWAISDDGFLFESTDGGYTWPLQTSLPAANIVGMAVGTSQDVVFAAVATASGSVYTGWPGSWGFWGNVPSSDVTAIAIRGNGRIILLSNSGNVWVDFSLTDTLPGQDWKSLTLQRDRSALLHAVSNDGRITESTDGGRTWSEAEETGIANAVEIISSGDALYLLTGSGAVWRRLAASSAWDSIGSVPGSNLVSLAIESNRFYACASNGAVAVSTDGATWSWAGVVGANIVCLGSSDTPTAVLSEERAGIMRVGFPWPNPSPAGLHHVTFPLWASEGGVVSVSVFDIRGRRVALLGSSTVVAGTNLFRWTPKDLSAGMYLVRFAGGRNWEQSVPLTIRAD